MNAAADNSEERVWNERRATIRRIDEHLTKIEDLVVRSDGEVRADVVHERIRAAAWPTATLVHLPVL